MKGILSAFAICVSFAASNVRAQTSPPISKPMTPDDMAAAVAAHYSSLGASRATADETFFSPKPFGADQHATVVVTTSGGASWVALPHTQARVRCDVASELFFLCGDSALALFSFQPYPKGGAVFIATPKIPNAHFSELIVSFGPSFEVKAVLGVGSTYGRPLFRITFTP